MKLGYKLGYVPEKRHPGAEIKQNQMGEAVITVTFTHARKT